MAAPVYLGDEVSAAGYRLAGVECAVPPPGGEGAALHEALAKAPLVLVSPDVAARIDPQVLRQALAALAPLVVIVPDTQGVVPRPDLAARLRARLGLPA
ncbi:MAG TPA: V-type ATP synthase subunit F [Casimicrobiaceae bacterium]|nr:V-type ATP synthase subunit F [Casimicrobiaceae bacterium]